MVVVVAAVVDARMEHSAGQNALEPGGQGACDDQRVDTCRLVSVHKAVRLIDDFSLQQLLDDVFYGNYACGAGHARGADKASGSSSVGISCL